MTARRPAKPRRVAEVPSPPSDARREPPAERRRPGRPTLSNEQLLDRALEIFLEQGFDRTSVDAITAAAGMAKRTLYQRYGDKKTLFKAALERAIDDWIVPPQALKEVETADLEETLLNVANVLVANIMSPAGIRLLRITNAESGRLPEIGAYTYELGTERTILYLADLLRSRTAPGSDDGDRWREAAIAFMYLVVTGPPTMTAWGLELDGETVERHTRFSVRLFLHGFAGAVRGGSAVSPVTPQAGNGGLEAENRRLRGLLVDAMLDAARLREERAG